MLKLTEETTLKQHSKAILHCVSEKNATFSLFLYNSVKNNLILIVFGRKNLENIYIGPYLSTTPEKCHHTILKIAQLFHLTEVV